MKLKNKIVGSGKKGTVYGVPGDKVVFASESDNYKIFQDKDVVIVKQESGKGSPFSVFASDLDT